MTGATLHVFYRSPDSRHVFYDRTIECIVTGYLVWVADRRVRELRDRGLDAWHQAEWHNGAFT